MSLLVDDIRAGRAHRYRTDRLTEIAPPDMSRIPPESATDELER